MISSAGLIGVGLLHMAWAAGATWPARSREQLAEYVVGNPDAMPPAAPTALVAGAALVGGVASGGVLGDGKGVLAVRWVAGAALLTRAALGGGAALVALGLPPAREAFQRLDRRVYRPLCAILGLATIAALLSPRR